MYHKIRITVVLLVAMMICMLSSTATLSYFTDTDVKTSDFTIGNASTNLVIYGDEAGGSELDASSYIATDDNNIPFYLQAENNGNIPVYQRFRVVIPIDLSGVVTLSLPTMNDNCEITITSRNTCSNEDYIVTYDPSVKTNEEDEEATFAEYYIVSKQVLDVNRATTRWPVMGIRISDISSIEKESLYTCADNSANNCKLRIGAYSDVIQTTGFVGGVENAFASFRETY